MTVGTDRHDDALISVVTPVYNAAEYLLTLYDCLRAQTYKKWEWVVVNDGSTDNSGHMLRTWAEADSRIRYHESTNSGSAKQPRDMAVYLSASDYVVPIDADDYVDTGYLRRIWNRMTETGADIVYPVMRFVEEDGRCTQELPAAGFDRTKVYGGRQLVRETVPRWNIGCNGGLYHKAVWNNLSYPEKRTPVWMNSDEVDERLYLVRAGRVAFADTVYYYVNHGGSITSKVSPKLFHRLKTDRVLAEFISGEFGADSEEAGLVNRQIFCTWRGLLALFVARLYELPPDCRDRICADLAVNFRLTSVSSLSVRERLMFLNLCSFRLTAVLFCIKYSPRHLPGIMRLLCRTDLRPKQQGEHAGW